MLYLIEMLTYDSTRDMEGSRVAVEKATQIVSLIRLMDQGQMGDLNRFIVM